MKKISLSILSLLAFILILAGCGSKHEITDYVKVTFDGMDTKGTAIATLDYDKITKEVYGVEKPEDYEKMSEEEKNEYDKLQYVEIKLDKDQNLSNGEKVKATINLDEEEFKSFKEGTKEIKVENLKEPKKLSNEEIKKNVIPKYSGASGKGQATLENTFDGELGNVQFDIENNGKLKNGEKTHIVVNKESDNLDDYGYIMEDPNGPEVEVRDLEEFAEDAKDIKNYDSIIRMIDENTKEEYKKGEFSSTEYKVNEIGTYYRQLNKEDEYNYSETNGSLIKLYDITEYDEDGKELDSYRVVRGFNGIKLDEDKKTNVTDMQEYVSRYSEGESVETVKDLLEGHDYVEVK